MATTQLFVELLIIGVGVTIWLSFLLAMLFRVSWEVGVSHLESIHVAAILGVAYVLGILVDRAAWRIFRRSEERHRLAVFGESPTPGVGDRERYILVNAPALREQILYNRSRLRICRSWILNFALVALLSALWAAQQRAWQIMPLSGAAAVLAVLATRVSSALSRDHYNNVRASYEFLIRYEEARGAG